MLFSFASSRRFEMLPIPCFVPEYPKCSMQSVCFKPLKTHSNTTAQHLLWNAEKFSQQFASVKFHFGNYASLCTVFKFSLIQLSSVNISIDISRLCFASQLKCARYLPLLLCSSITLNTHLRTKLGIDKRLLIGIHFLIYYYWKLRRCITFYVTSAVVVLLPHQLKSNYLC